MARVAEAGTIVALDPARTLELWADLDRWPAFIEGFARIVERTGEWPLEGSAVLWESIPDGRGRVRERVTAHAAPGARGSGSPGSGLLVTAVEDDTLAGTQTVAFHPIVGGTRVELDLSYELTQAGPLGAVTDFVFIRRALRDALRRTLLYFAAEAEQEPGAA